MPQRQFSATILAGAWPHTDPQSLQSAADVQQAKGVDLLDNADTCRQARDNAAADQSGQAIDGFGDKCTSYASTYTTQADQYFAIKRVCEECARLVYGLREDLDQIDSEAHQQIAQIKEAIQKGFSAVLGGVQIMGVIAAARAAATAKSAEVTAAVAAEGAKIGIGGPPGTGGESSSPAVDPDLQALQDQGGFGGGGPGGPRSGGMPTGRLPGQEAPASPPGTQPEAGGQRHGVDGEADEGHTPSEGKAHTDDGAPSGYSPGDDGDAPRAASQRHDADGLGGSSFASPGAGMPSGGSSSSPVSSLGSASGLSSSGLPKMPSAPGGLGSGGLPTQGLGSAGGLGSGGGLPGGAGAPSGPAAPSDFSRGLSAGLGAGGPAAPFAPPVSPPASTAGSAAPAGVAPSGPAPVAAAAGSAAAAVPAPPLATTGSSGVGSMGGGVPAGPVGALPPFGSDAARAATAAAAVAPAAGPAAAAPSAAGGGAGAGPVAPLPPGVVGSGVGAATGAANEGIRASLPDPLLASASQLLYQLLHDSRMYPYMDWCVGVFRTSSGIETLIVNSEGAGYIPTGVFVPRSARLLFADGGLSPEFRARWFSWANPAETMLAYARLAAEHRTDIELWALAVSTDDGGSSMPARPVVQHFEDCSRSLSPLRDDAPTSQLDDTHSHRLEALDRALYSRLTGFGDGPLPDRSEAWRTTASAAQVALGCAGSIPDLAVSPAIREVLDRLAQGLPVPASSWQELEAAHIGAVMSGAGLRPGRLGDDAGTRAHVLAHHDVARLVELLLLWRSDSIAYPEIAYLAGQIHLAPRMGGGGQ